MGWENGRRIFGATALFAQGFIGLTCSSVIGLLIWGNGGAATAQPIQSDGSLPVPTSVGPGVSNGTGTTWQITGGTEAGSNLFHSFSNFSVPVGDIAEFLPSLGTSQIFARVTGGNLSQIDGKIQIRGGAVNTGAHLFLLNPQGILFGPNAQLNIGGSLFATTAQGIQFSDGLFTADPSIPSLLSVNVPMGLQFGMGTAESGTIGIQGPGNSALLPDNATGLNVASGQTLSLIGNGVDLSGAILTASLGRIEVGSVAKGTVGISQSGAGWRLNYPQSDLTLADVTLRDRTSLYQLNADNNGLASNLASLDGDLTGIQVVGRQITLQDSQITTITTGAKRGGAIDLRASNALTLLNRNTSIDPYSSQITSEVASGASGLGGSIQIGTPLLTIQNGAQIASITKGVGESGNIAIQSESITVDGYAPFVPSNPLFGNSNSSIDSLSLSSGKTGDITITADRLNLLNGGQITVSTAPEGTGKSGNITIIARDALNAIGFNQLDPVASSGIFHLNGNADNGASQVSIQAGNVTLRDGGLILSVAGGGPGADLNVDVEGLLLGEGINPFYQSTRGGIVSLTTGDTKGGDILVNAQQVMLRNGANITSGGLSNIDGLPIMGSGRGRVGDVTVNVADSLEIRGVSPSNPSLASFVGSQVYGEGQGGDVVVEAARVVVRDGGKLSAQVYNGLIGLTAPTPGIQSGRGGSVTVRASDSVLVEGTNPFLADPSTLGTSTTSNGDAGNVTVNAPRIRALKGGSIGSFTLSSGATASLVTITAQDILVEGQSSRLSGVIGSAAIQLSPKALAAYYLSGGPTGIVGSMKIQADRLTIRDGGIVSVAHGGVGDAGTLDIDAGRLILDNRGQLSAATVQGNGGNLNLSLWEGLVMDHQSLILAAASRGDGGNINIQAPWLFALDNSDIIANARGGKGGQIRIASQGIWGTAVRDRLTPESDITATSDQSAALDGIVNLLQILKTDPSPVLDQKAQLLAPPSFIASLCGVSESTGLVATGKGGLPRSPLTTLAAQVLWNEGKIEPQFSRRAVTNFDDAALQSRGAGDLREAAGWQVDPAGKTHLVAMASLTEWSGFTCAGGKRD